MVVVLTTHMDYYTSTCPGPFRHVHLVSAPLQLALAT